MGRRIQRNTGQARASENSSVSRLAVVLLTLERRWRLGACNTGILSILFLEPYRIHTLAGVPGIHIIKPNRIGSTQRVLRACRKGVERIKSVVLGVIIPLSGAVTSNDEVEIQLQEKQRI